MTALSEIYDRAFFSEYGARNATYAAACALIAGEIHRRFSPRTVVDWGAGAGLHAAELSRLGAQVVAVDGAAIDPDLCGAVHRVQADLTQPIDSEDIPAHYDLALCIDVLEHIDDANSDHVLATITRGAEMVILSCAPPGQGGHHHVNEQPRRYWVAKMAALGWRYDRRETGQMERTFLTMRDRLPESWMYHNLCVYRP